MVNLDFAARIGKTMSLEAPKYSLRLTEAAGRYDLRADDKACPLILGNLIKPENMDYSIQPFVFKEFPNLASGAIFNFEKNGARTRVVHVLSDSIITDIPVSGSGTFIAVDPEGNGFIRKVIAERRASSEKVRYTKGWKLVWLSDPDSADPFKFVQICTPPFKKNETERILEGEEIPEFIQQQLQELEI